MLGVADLAAFVTEGRVALCGEPQALLANPQEAGLRGYLGLKAD